MALVNRVLEGCEAFAIVYMDDILILSVDEDEHLKHFQIIFERLTECKVGNKVDQM